MIHENSDRIFCNIVNQIEVIEPDDLDQVSQEGQPVDPVTAENYLIKNQSQLNIQTIPGLRGPVNLSYDLQYHRHDNTPYFRNLPEIEHSNIRARVTIGLGGVVVFGLVALTYLQARGR